MAIEIIISADMWNEKNHSDVVSSYDQISVLALFDQPVSHELEYIEKDVTNFWIEISIGDELIATLKSNKVVNELMDEAKTFKNGKFKFSLCKLPDALTNHHHAVFAKKMAEIADGTYSVKATFHTDNPLQAGQVLAERVFSFEKEAGSEEHLIKVASENLAMGADQVDDAAAKMEKFANINRPAEKFDEVAVTLVNKSSGDLMVMAGYNSGKKIHVNHGQSTTVAVPAGTEFYKLTGNECTTNYGSASPRQKAQTLDVY